MLRATTAALSQLGAMREREGAVLRADVEKHAAVIRDVYVYIYRRLEDVPPEEAARALDAASTDGTHGNAGEAPMPPPAVPRSSTR